MAFALTGARLFDGEKFLDDNAVVVEGPRIAAVVPASELPAGLRRTELAGGILAPGFIDVQVNGGGGALLNADPTANGVCTIAASHRRFGTTAMLPTVITDAPHVLAAALDAVRSARAAGEASVLGIHVEGPFLDPQRKGAHEAQFIRTMQEADVEQLASSNCGELMLTLAPNKVPPNLIRQLVARGVRVSLGHSEASFAEAEAAIDAGATSFTHLFNAMSQWEGRQPGMVGAALSDPRTFVGIIADGFHAHDVSLRLALTAASPDRFMLVSDAMPPAAGGPDTFELQGRRVTRVNGRLQLADGTLAGSNLTMDEAVRHCVNRLGLPLATALQMASRNPARFLGRSHDLGIVSVSALASLVHLDQELNVQRTWVEGT